MLEFRLPTYEDILKLEPTFISLDISVRSTGWVRSINGKVEWGTKALETEENLARRREYRQFLKDTFKDQEYPCLWVEDAIAGNNFKTTRILVELNAVAEDAVADGIINVKKFERQDNNEWKMYLKMAANYEADIKKEDPKVSIVNCMNLLGFKEDVAQDVYDAMGMAVAVIYREKILNKERIVTGPLKDDLKKGFTIKQAQTEKELEKQADKLKKKFENREVVDIDWVGQSRDVLYLFKQMVNKEDRDDRIYKIRLNSQKLGILALKKELDTSEDITYLLITKNK